MIQTSGTRACIGYQNTYAEQQKSENLKNKSGLMPK